MDPQVKHLVSKGSQCPGLILLFVRAFKNVRLFNNPHWVIPSSALATATLALLRPLLLFKLSLKKLVELTAIHSGAKCLAAHPPQWGFGPLSSRFSAWELQPFMNDNWQSCARVTTANNPWVTLRAHLMRLTQAETALQLPTPFLRTLSHQWRTSLPTFRPTSSWHHKWLVVTQPWQLVITHLAKGQTNLNIWHFKHPNGDERLCLSQSPIPALLWVISPFKGRFRLSTCSTSWVKQVPNSANTTK